MGYEFKVIAPSIDEKSIRFDEPEKLALALANAKANALLATSSFAGAEGFCINDQAFNDCIEKVEGEIDSVAGLPKAVTEKLIKEVQN